MPQIGGKDLAERLKNRQPDLAVLFMSGYTDQAVLDQAIVDEGDHFLAKPFAPETLAHEVTTMLESGGSGPGRNNRAAET